MSHDIVIRNGTIVDGTGLPGYRGDLAIKEGRIVAIGGRITESADEVIDASDLIVAPGFIEGHTHMDAQVNWDPLGTPLCYHGITSVVMGNCGFTLAPCKADQVEFYCHALEAVEDISAEAMLAGIDFTWETYADYLDALERLPKGINYGGYVGHSALRMYVMGERALSEPANDDDLRQMRRELQDALRAGAMGFSTSRTTGHCLKDGRRVASAIAALEELASLVGQMGEMNAGIFESAGGKLPEDPEEFDWDAWFRALAVETRRPFMFAALSLRRMPGRWQSTLAELDRAAAAGGTLVGQATTGAQNLVQGFKGNLPFDVLPGVWADLRAKPLEEQQVLIQDPAMREQLVAAANVYDDAGRQMMSAAVRKPDWEYFYALDDVSGPNPSLADLARQRGQDPVEVMLDLSAASDMNAWFQQPITNEDSAVVLEIMRHPRTVISFSDAGAHVSQVTWFGMQSHLFSYWVRQAQALTVEEAVRMVTLEVANHWGLWDRGLLRPGLKADLTLFDADTIGAQMPEMRYDLPAGARRLFAKANGITHTLVNGQVLLRDGEHTGAYPGEVLRGAAASR